MRILLAEDDAMIGEAVVQALQDAAFAVDWVQDGPTALSSYKNEDYALLLLDLGLPGVDGLQVLKELRHQQSELPVIIVTARDAVEDRIRGLDYGADDYLVKPFAAEELLARIRAVIRRRQGSANPLLTTADLTLDPATRQVTHRNETQLLSAREYAILHALMQRPGGILSRDDLEDRVYGWNEEVSSNAIEFTIHSLRKKLGKSAIKNVRGLGWMVNK